MLVKMKKRENNMARININDTFPEFIFNAAYENDLNSSYQRCLL